MAADPRRSTLLPLELGLPPQRLPPVGPEVTPPAACRLWLRLLLRHHPLLRLHLDDVQRAIVAGDVGALPALLTAQPAPPPPALPRLVLAAMVGEPAAVEVLLRRGPGGGPPDGGRDALGNSALHWAAIAGGPEVAAQLRAGGIVGGRNLLHGTPEDYAAAWAVAPPGRLDLRVWRRGGGRARLRRAAAARAELGFTYMPRSRVGVDFFLQLALGVADPAWAAQAAALLGDGGHRLRPAPEPAMALRDDGPPWHWGVCLREPVAEGQAVSHYGGDLVHALEVAQARTERGPNPYDCHVAPSAALGRLLHCHVDARARGNLGSRFNGAHVAAAANLVPVAGFLRGLPHVQLVACRPLAAGSQLAWDYGAGYWRGLGLRPTPLRP